MMGAREVLASCAGWLMVSASRITSCRDLASSNILSISLWTSAAQTTHREIYQVWTLLTDSCTRGRAHLSWSECWIAPWWAVCWGPTSWLKKDPPLHEWLRFCRKTRRKKKIIHKLLSVGFIQAFHIIVLLSMPLTFPRICVSESQTELSASCPSPGKHQETGFIKGS